jgi:hypothetical protein
VFAGVVVSIGGSRSRSKAQAKGRVCAYPECTTKLSVYNQDPTCFVHNQARGQVGRRNITPRARPSSDIE